MHDANASILNFKLFAKTLESCWKLQICSNMHDANASILNFKLFAKTRFWHRPKHQQTFLNDQCISPFTFYNFYECIISKYMSLGHETGGKKRML